MNEDKVEPVVYLLFAGMVVFAILLFVSEKIFPSDGQMFQVIAGMLTGFSGAFFMRVKPKDGGPSIPEGGSGTTSTTTTVKVPAEPDPVPAAPRVAPAVPGSAHAGPITPAK